MKKLILFLILAIFIGNVTAIEISSGESYSFNLQNYAYYIISGNSTIVDLNVSQDGNFVTIYADKYMQSDSFEITFYNEKDEVISSGGHHKKKIIKKEDFNNTPTGGGGSSISPSPFPPIIPPINIPPKETQKNSWLILIIVLIFLISLIIVLIKRREKDVRRYKNGNKENRNKESESKEERR